MRTEQEPERGPMDASYPMLLLVLGWAMPWSVAKAAPAFQTFEIANATTTSLTITKPTGVVQNDLLLATISVRGNTTITPPTGWQQIQSTNNGTSETLGVFYRVATATDIAAANYAFGLSANIWGGRGHPALHGGGPTLPH